VDGAPARREALELLAELHFWALEEGIDRATAEIYLLRMNELELQAKLQHAEFEQLPALSARLLRIRESIASLEKPPA